MDGAIDPNNLWILTGPTASGKSALSLLIAGQYPVEIVNLDSMQVYKGMDIGTSKVAQSVRDRVPHHLFDLLTPQESGHIAWWLTEATRTILDIQHRGKIALLVGGTMLYLRSFLRGMDSGPPPDEAFRSLWEKRAQEEGTSIVHEELARLDQKSAQRIPPGDIRRVIRAMEILKNQPKTDETRHWETPATRPQHGLWIGLEIPREELRRNIGHTVRKMVQEGWLEEVKELAKSEVPWSKEAGQAIGYTLLKSHLTNGGPIEPVLEKIIQGTCQFAKRQQTWLRSMTELRLLPLSQARVAFLGSDHFPPQQLASKAL
ncbi:MAG: tRNA (adenosine(37)-N6)-dimethylallyltransferase MiaA [Gemmataceae bacterium]|nr:tRNA (adenosine(37)-N6)-dimethylallyltransferase MiaA [Gemmataceae bacterium]